VEVPQVGLYTLLGGGDYSGARNLLSRPPRRGRSELGRESGSERAGGARGWERMEQASGAAPRAGFPGVRLGGGEIHALKRCFRQ
jgi:hypothetical protein